MTWQIKCPMPGNVSSTESVMDLPSADDLADQVPDARQRVVNEPADCSLPSAATHLSA
jgi:hypothetical protein